MTQQTSLPDLETVKRRASQVQNICERADVGILILDDLIAQVEQNIRSSSTYRYRLSKEKHSLNL
jgi:predicted transcriptional regulator